MQGWRAGAAAVALLPQTCWVADVLRLDAAAAAAAAAMQGHQLVKLGRCLALKHSAQL
jgi:hypothetical protein